MDNVTEKEVIILDGQEVTREKLEEQMKRRDVKVVPIEEGSKSFKTLTRLQE
jgi:hypothetical protein